MATATDRRTRVPDTRSHDPIRPGRLAMVFGVGGALLWITFAATLAQVGLPGQLETVRRIWPFAAASEAQTAETALADLDATSPRQPVAEAAAHALLREPVNVIAARVAGMTASLDGDDRRARRLLAYAETLSRRDLGTQIALIEFAVADGDVPRALQHYDKALRTKRSADPLLMPVLVQASRDPEVATALGSMLARRPPWRMRFVYSLIEAQPWAPTFQSLIGSARLGVRDPLERDFLARSLKGLVASNQTAAAARLYEQATGVRVGTGTRNGNFAGQDRIAPFDWEITDEPGLSGLPGAGDEPGLPSALSLEANAGRSGVVARQMLLLPAGRHRLKFLTGNVGEADRSRVQITCNGTDALLAAQRLPRTDAGLRAVQMVFDVPPVCVSGGQWLNIEAATDIDAGRQETAPWVSGLTIIR
jgi:hypothetical protein